MNITSLSVQLASSNPEALRAFYHDVVQLPLDPEMGDGAFVIGPGGNLFVVDHSEVSGPAREPARSIIDLHITGIDEEHERLRAAGVAFTREKGVEWWGGVISTFNDPDGNIIQLIEFKPELSRPEDAEVPVTA